MKTIKIKCYRCGRVQSRALCLKCQTELREIFNKKIAVLFTAAVRNAFEGKSQNICREKTVLSDKPSLSRLKAIYAELNSAIATDKMIYACIARDMLETEISAWQAICREKTVLSDKSSLSRLKAIHAELSSAIARGEMIYVSIVKSVLETEISVLQGE
jgi:acid stress-induced BolA-like protein IbaG/YrbA